MEQPKLDITLEELYQIVGELEIVRRKQTLQLQQLYKQVDEMMVEISRLRSPEVIEKV